MFFQIKAIKADVFAWLGEIQNTLTQQERNEVEDNDVDNEDDENFFNVRGVGSRITRNKMKELILNNMTDFASMNAEKTVLLCDQWFEDIYIRVAEDLTQHSQSKELAYKFLEAVIHIHEPDIEKEYKQAVLLNQNQKQISDKYELVILKLLEILAERKVKNYAKLIVEFVSKVYVPILPALEICKQKKAVEAQAVLQKRKGDYKQAIDLYL